MLVDVDGTLHPTGGSTGKHAEDADSTFVHLVAQAVCNRPERVFGCRVLRHALPAMDARTRIDEDHLTAAAYEVRQKRLCELIRCPDVHLILGIEVGQRALVDTAEGDGASRVHEEMHLLTRRVYLRRKLPDIAFDGKINGMTPDGFRIPRVLSNDLIESAPSPCHEKDRGTSCDEPISNRLSNSTRSARDDGRLSGERAHQASLKSSCCCSVEATVRTISKGSLERSAMSSNVWVPSDRLRTQSSASSMTPVSL